MNYYVIETQTRNDGVVNIATTQRSTFASALSLWHERYSKMCVDKTFKSVSIMLVDKNLTVLENATVETQYKEEVTENTIPQNRI